MSSTLTELKTAVTKLSSDEVVELLDWLEEYQQLQWDQQIEADLNLGKLDHLIQQAEEAFQQGKCKPM